MQPETNSADSASIVTSKTPFWRRFVVDPLIDQLKQGAEPHKLAQSMAWGFGLGIFPILGTSTTMCGITAIWLRLNHVAIQLMNWLVYPLQILLIIPFLQFGNILFGIESSHLSLKEITASFEHDFWSAAQSMGGLALRGIVAWALLVLPMVFLVTRALNPIMIRLSNRNIRKVRNNE